MWYPTVVACCCCCCLVSAVGVVKLEHDDFAMRSSYGLDTDGGLLMREVMGTTAMITRDVLDDLVSPRDPRLSLSNIGDVQGYSAVPRPRRSDWAFNSQDGFGDPDPDRQLDVGASSADRQTWMHLLSFLQAKAGMYLTIIVMELCDR
jgi:hypothetical protein